MPDTLRTRIAAVLFAMDCDDYDIQAGEGLGPSVLWAIQEGAERRADAVIAELNLDISHTYKTSQGREVCVEGFWTEEGTDGTA